MHAFHVHASFTGAFQEHKTSIHFFSLTKNLQFIQQLPRSDNILTIMNFSPACKLPTATYRTRCSYEEKLRLLKVWVRVHSEERAMLKRSPSAFWAQKIFTKQEWLMSSYVITAPVTTSSLQTNCSWICCFLEHSMIHSQARIHYLS